MNLTTKLSTPKQFAILLAAFFALCFFIGPSESNYLWRLPALFSGLPGVINDAVQFVMFEWFPIEVYDPDIEEFEEKPLFREITRSISNSFLLVITFVREIFLGGTKTIVAFTSWDFISKNPWASWPALPWTVIAGWAIVLGYKLQGKGLAILAAFATGYIGIFGQ